MILPHTWFCFLFYFLFKISKKKLTSCFIEILLFKKGIFYRFVHVNFLDTFLLTWGKIYKKWIENVCRAPKGLTIDTCGVLLVEEDATKGWKPILNKLQCVEPMLFNWTHECLRAKIIIYGPIVLTHECLKYSDVFMKFHLATKIYHTMHWRKYQIAKEKSLWE